MTNLLIVPKSMIQEGYTPPPLGLLNVAAMDSGTYIIDNANEPTLDVVSVFKYVRPRIVGVPIYTAGRVEALRLLKAAKEAGAITVAGGPHVSIMHEQLAAHYPFIDHLVVGDGELAWKEITCGGKAPRVLRMRVPHFDILPLPAWNRVNVQRYPARGAGVHRGNDLGVIPRISVVFGRGCIGACGFCSTWHLNGAYRNYGLEWTKRNLTELWKNGVRHLMWQDDCLTANHEGTMGLCKLLTQFGFSSIGVTRADCMDDEMAKALAEAGFYEISFGLESGSEYILKRMNKKADIGAAFKAREALKKAGIIFTALMVYGYPYETDQTRRETAEFLQKLSAEKVCSVGYTMVMPGTALYIECKRAGLINDDFWLGEEPYYVYRGGLI